MAVVVGGYRHRVSGVFELELLSKGSISAFIKAEYADHGSI